MGTNVINGTSGDDTLLGSTKNDQMFGLEGNDLLSADKGSDLLSGGLGNDTLTGGDGHDTFVFDSRMGGSDVITDFTRREKIDLSAFGIGSVEQLAPFMSQVGSDVVIHTQFNSIDEVITIQHTTLGQLGSGAFLLNHGKAGVDQTGSAGSDDLFGSRNADTLHGLEGDDYLSGGTGADVLHGGAGADTLVGGNQRDSFTFSDGDLPTDGTHDFIADYHHTDHDRIDVAGVDADVSIAGNQAFTLVDGSFTAAGQLHVTNIGEGVWLIEMNVDADLESDYAIEVASKSPVSPSDLVL